VSLVATLVLVAAGGLARADEAASAALGDMAATRPGAGRHPNALIHERSPYLREHAFDPVDWHPWGKAAFEEAKRRGVPVFVSSGYSTCHWCHVMHRESFEDEEAARKLDAAFVCVKVDREELPDVDEGLIRVVQAVQGDAGWPCTVFLLPDGRPLYGGTYFPKNALLDMAGNIADLWKDPEKRKSMASDAKDLQDFLARTTSLPRGRAETDRTLIRNAVVAFAKDFDPKNGGFGKGHKFPRGPDLSFLLRDAHSETARKLALATLDRILAGGIHDHVGGGFHRYTVDEEWKVPHFEKTLYDQALLTDALVDAYELTRDERYARAARTTCDYVLRDLATPSGGFATAEDADSSGGEGRFYTWTKAEVEAVCADDRLAAFVCSRFGVEAAGAGPVEGRSVLRLAVPLSEFASPVGDPVLLESEGIAALASARAARVRPPRDEKVLAGWNGLMIAALARASLALSEPRFLDAALAAARTVATRLVSPGGRDGLTAGRLLRRLVGDEARFPGALEDHAYLVRGYAELYEATLDPEWLERAQDLLARARALFWDGARFTARAKDQPALLASPVEGTDEGALPSPAAVLAEEDVRLSSLAGREPELARSELASVSTLLAREPEAVPTFLAALDRLLSEPVTIVISGTPGDATRDLVREARARPLPPIALLALVDGSDGAKRALGELAQGREPGPRPRAFVCVGKTCKEPALDAAALRALLDGLGR
jgi:uncharacterized protein YyaL (SSP411 family)